MMRFVRLILFTLLLCGLTLVLSADDAWVGAFLEDVDLTVIVIGFHDFKDTQFYKVHTENIYGDPNIQRFYKIKSDTIHINPVWKYDGEWLSANPKYASKKEGIPYKIPIESDDCFGVPCPADPYFAGCPEPVRFPGFKSVRVYYRIVKPGPDSEDAEYPFATEPDKMVLDHQKFQLTVRDEFYDWWLNDIGSVLEIEEYSSDNQPLVFSDQDIETLMLYATNTDNIEVVSKSKAFSRYLANLDQSKWPELKKRMESPEPEEPAEETSGHDRIPGGSAGPEPAFSESKGEMFVDALLLSIFVEILVLLGLYRPVTKKDTFADTKTLLTIIITCALATAVTISIVWWVFPKLIPAKVPGVISAEIFAVLAEALIFARVFRTRFPRALLLSFLCNLASFAVGYIVRG